MTRVVTGTVVAALVVAGGYVWADVHDFVPGILTLGPEPVPPAPFPTAPGATLGAAPVGTLSTLDPGAPSPSRDQLQAAVDALATDPVLGPSVGVVVSDALTGEVLASATPSTPRVPASIQKLFTAAAALSTLDADDVLTTTVTQAAPGRLTLVGGGDMMLAAGTGDPSAVSGHAGLEDLAAQVASSLGLTGITSVRLSLDDTLFTGSATGPWADDIPSLGFAAPVAAVAVDTGRLREGEYAPRETDPAMAAAKTFAAALAAHGITVEGDPTRAASSADATVVASVDSAPLGKVVEYFLHSSDNTITEVVARLVAIHAGLPASFDGATQAVVQQLVRLGVDTSGLTLADASGLGDGSRASATTLVDLLGVMSSRSNPELRTVMTGMPVAALDGTLVNRFVGTGAAGLVRAKTGSLPGVTSLAGNLLTADGRELLFVVMADQTPGPGQGAARAAVDGFVDGLTDCGCR